MHENSGRPGVASAESGNSGVGGSPVFPDPYKSAFIRIADSVLDATMNFKNDVQHNSFRCILGEHLVAPLSFGFALVRGA
eukprot:COSAG02_NODE_5345_length_4414_cov_1.372654_3_plen_80_part_00